MKIGFRLVLVVIAACMCTPFARAKDEPAIASVKPEARQRDEAAAKDAVDGWWTAALKTRDQRLAWWRDARFGCFIHWGVYSSLAGEYNGRKGGSYSEHIM